MYCQKCGKELSEGVRFCSGCGDAVSEAEISSNRTQTDTEYSQVSFCTKCGKELSGDEAFCSSCGTQLVKRGYTRDEAGTFAESCGYYGEGKQTNYGNGQYRSVNSGFAPTNFAGNIRAFGSSIYLLFAAVIGMFFTGLNLCFLPYAQNVYNSDVNTSFIAETPGVAVLFFLLSLTAIALSVIPLFSNKPYNRLFLLGCYIDTGFKEIFTLIIALMVADDARSSTTAWLWISFIFGIIAIISSIMFSARVKHMSNKF